MKKVEKGSVGYIEYQKKLKGIICLIGILIVITIFVAGLIIYKDRNNILTVVSILSVLPFAKFCVNFFMFFRFKSCNAELYKKIEQCDSKLLHKYDCIFTSKEHVTFAPVIVISPKGVCCYTEAKKCDVKQFETDLKKFVKNARLDISVSLINDEKTFLKRIKLMSDSNENADSKESIDKMGWIWDSVKCMCL